ncbi:mitochondrial calcium uniporter regulator 1-like [Saimiri boliviensis]|uniref:mitochondrial calcium uniporter regulator 1-like n=1 Tax=Saimiri boliviensis TaxID=27679 RepID=UPI003D78611F
MACLNPQLCFNKYDIQTSISPKLPEPDSKSASTTGWLCDLGQVVSPLVTSVADGCKQGVEAMCPRSSLPLRVDASTCQSPAGVTWLCPKSLSEGHSMAWNTMAFWRMAAWKEGLGHGRELQEQVAFEMSLEEGKPIYETLLQQQKRYQETQKETLQLERKRRDFTSSGSRKLYFDTHALVCLLEDNGFATQQAEIIVSALVKILEANMDIVYKDMVTKMQQEITLQQIMSQIANVKKDMIILEKSEFSALRDENEKVKLELPIKVRTDTKLDFNLEKSRVKELYSLNEKKLLELRTEIVALHAQQDRALTQTDRKIETEVAGLKTMLESHKLDNIKYLAGSIFTCLTVALGFYRLWI